MTEQQRPSRLARLVSMTDQEFERLCWRIVFLLGIVAGTVLLFTFVGMMVTAAILMSIEVVQAV